MVSSCQDDLLLDSERAYVGDSDVCVSAVSPIWVEPIGIGGRSDVCVLSPRTADFADLGSKIVRKGTAGASSWILPAAVLSVAVDIPPRLDVSNKDDNAYGPNPESLEDVVIDTVCVLGTVDPVNPVAPCRGDLS